VAGLKATEVAATANTTTITAIPLTTLRNLTSSQQP